MATVENNVINQKMKLFRFFFLICFLISGLLFSSCKDENSVGVANKDYTAAVKSVIQNALESIKKDDPEFPGGLALLVKYPGGKIFVETGFTNPVTEKTHFRAASNTKSLTATAILLLYQRGKINLNAKITDTIPGTNQPYIPDDQNYNIPFKNSITILQLLQHRAGVFDVSNDMIPDTIQANVPYKGDNYIDYIQERTPEHTFTFDELTAVNSVTGLYYFAPGAAWKYSNSGYVLLGKIVERVSGKGYSDFVKDEILIPMGMMSSSMPFLGSDRQLPVPFVPGFVHYPTGIENKTISNISGNVAEGNLITTPEDLSLYLRELLSGRGVLSSTTVNFLMLNGQPTSPGGAMIYACGLQLTPMLGWGHTGAHEGYLSEMNYDPVSDVTMVIYTNGWDIREGITSIGKTMTHMREALYKTKGIVLGR